jgi:hypothetical protein
MLQHKSAGGDCISAAGADGWLAILYIQQGVLDTSCLSLAMLWTCLHPCFVSSPPHGICFCNTVTACCCLHSLVCDCR